MLCIQNQAIPFVMRFLSRVTRWQQVKVNRYIMGLAKHYPLSYVIIPYVISLVISLRTG